MISILESMIRGQAYISVIVDGRLGFKLFFIYFLCCFCSAQERMHNAKLTVSYIICDILGHCPGSNSITEFFALGHPKFLDWGRVAEVVYITLRKSDLIIFFSSFLLQEKNKRIECWWKKYGGTNSLMRIQLNPTLVRIKIQIRLVESSMSCLWF